MNFDAIWDAWLDAGHGDCGGWRYDPDPDGGVAKCACGAVISPDAAGDPVVAA